jgi:UDP-N-acetylmuramoylalanine--D-glutamate ligase
VLSFQSPVILIAGGKDKGLDFSPLTSALNGRAKALVLIGEATSKLEQTAKKTGFNNIIKAGSLEDAITKSISIAKQNDVIMLSPACASFDMFKDFEDRGRQFKEAVKAL